MLEKKGLSQSNIAEALDVSRTIVSDWFNQKKSPRPKHLLQLSNILGLSYENLIIEESSNEPVVAFRKKAKSKTSLEHIENAKDRGWLLKPLVEFLPKEKFKLEYSSKVLLNPTLDYSHIEEIASDIRKEYLHESKDGKIPFTSLIKAFSDFKAVLIPVLLGKKEKHENAVQIFLPESKTNWVFLNIDTNIIDFKFWMTHEFAHLLTPNLTIEDSEKAEDFADAIAGAVLFSREKAEILYKEIERKTHDGEKINCIKKAANENMVALFTIEKQINKYLKNIGKEKLPFSVGGANTNFSKKFELVSDIIFDSNQPFTAKSYIQSTRDVFYSPFFDILRNYLIESKKSSSYISSILNMSPSDSQAIYEELLNEKANNPR